MFLVFILVELLILISWYFIFVILVFLIGFYGKLKVNDTLRDNLEKFKSLKNGKKVEKN